MPSLRNRRCETLNYNASLAELTCRTLGTGYLIV